MELLCLDNFREYLVIFSSNVSVSYLIMVPKLFSLACFGKICVGNGQAMSCVLLDQ